MLLKRTYKGGGPQDECVLKRLAATVLLQSLHTGFCSSAGSGFPFSSSLLPK